jgi:hypothetical protein
MRTAAKDLKGRPFHRKMGSSQANLSVHLQVFPHAWGAQIVATHETFSGFFRLSR